MKTEPHRQAVLKLRKSIYYQKVSESAESRDTRKYLFLVLSHGFIKKKYFTFSKEVVGEPVQW